MGARGEGGRRQGKARADASDLRWKGRELRDTSSGSRSQRPAMKSASGSLSDWDGAQVTLEELAPVWALHLGCGVAEGQALPLLRSLAPHPSMGVTPDGPSGSPQL